MSQSLLAHDTGLDAETTNGGLHVTDVGGTMSLHAVNGGLHLTRLSGAVTAETVNGGVHIDLMGDHWEDHGLEASSTRGPHQRSLGILGAA